MTFHQALSGLFVTAALGACAVQLDDEHAFNGDSAETAGTSGSSGSGGSTSTGKGGTTATGGSTSTGKGGSTSTGKGGSSGSGGASGGSGGVTSAGSGGVTSAGTGGSAGSAGSTGGTTTTASCQGLPEWVAGAQPPDAPMTSGEELGFNAKKWTYSGSGDLWNFDGACPPETTPEVVREGWCDGSAQNQYTLVGACE
jgi:hypothetical protein